MGHSIIDLEETFRPSATDPNWLGNVQTSSRAGTYGFPGQTQGTLATAYGAIDETVPYGYQGRTVPVYHDAYGTFPTIEPLSLLLGAVAGAVGVFCYNHCRNKGYF